MLSRHAGARLFRIARGDRTGRSDYFKEWVGAWPSPGTGGQLPTPPVAQPWHGRHAQRLRDRVGRRGCKPVTARAARADDRLLPAVTTWPVSVPTAQYRTAAYSVKVDREAWCRSVHACSPARERRVATAWVVSRSRPARESAPLTDARARRPGASRCASSSSEGRRR